MKEEEEISTITKYKITKSLYYTKEKIEANASRKKII